MIMNLSATESEGSETEDILDEKEEQIKKEEEELETMQANGILSRSEYLSKRKDLEKAKDRVRQKSEELQRKQKAEEQMERKRAIAKKALEEALQSKDVEQLKNAIEKGQECELQGKSLLLASHALETLEIEVAREKEIELRKKSFNELIRDKFLRSEPLGKDRAQNRYWIFNGDNRRLYVERPVLKKLLAKFQTNDTELSSQTASWYCYSSEREVRMLMESLDKNSAREKELKNALEENFDVITRNMLLPKEYPAMTDLLNMETVSGADAAEDTVTSRKRSRRSTPESEEARVNFGTWKNKLKVWRKKMHHELDIFAFRDDLIEVETWLGKRLKEVGTSWHDKNHPTWIKDAKSVQDLKDVIPLLLALEEEVYTLQVKTLLEQEAKKDEKINSEKTENEEIKAEEAEVDEDVATEEEDEEEEEEDEAENIVDDGTVLWPTGKTRNRWLSAVKNCNTIAQIAVALACFVQRLEIIGFSESASLDSNPKHRAKTEKEKRSRKERAAQRKQNKEEQEEMEAQYEDEEEDRWEEDCYVCAEGGEVLCCDGCRRVFHFTCVGLRRIPRGKTFCHFCDKSVKPIYPVRNAGPGKSGDKSRAGRASKREQQKEQSSSDSDATESDESEAEFEIETKHTEDQWDTECGVCLLGGELLCCDGCPRAFHLNCIGFKVSVSN
jgi:bromodomain adjacent to zinc finger domain protein 1A